MPPWLALIFAAVLAVFAQLALARPSGRAPGWILYAGSVALAVYAFVQGEGEGTTGRTAVPRPTGKQRHKTARRLALAGIAANVLVLDQLWNTGYAPYIAWLWIGSLSAIVAAGWLWGSFHPTTDPAPEASRAALGAAIPPWGEALLLAALILLAFFMRLYQLGLMPPGIFVDETNIALDALHILEGRPDSPFGTGWYETPTMYAYYLLPLFKTLGVNLAALKAASVMPALLTVLALYPLAREMFGIPTALTATFLLAINRWHVNMSRWGCNELAPPLFQIGATYFLLRGSRRQHLGDYALGGLLLGLGMYTYLASRLVVASVAAYVLYRALVERGLRPGASLRSGSPLRAGLSEPEASGVEPGPAGFLRRARGLALFCLVYAMAFAPLASHYVRDPFTFFNRSREIFILNDVRQAGSWKPVWDNVRLHLEMFHVAGDENPRHNLPGTPMLDAVTGALFLMGLGYSLRRWRDHRYGLLVIWFLVQLQAGILTFWHQAPQAHRTIGVMPAIAILAGHALVRGAVVFASPLGNRIWRAVPVVLATALLGWCGWLNFDTYFHRQANDVRVWEAFLPEEIAVAREITRKQPHQTIYLPDRLYNYSVVQFLTYQPLDRSGGGLQNPPYRWISPSDDLPLPDLSGTDALFLLDVHYADLLKLFTRYYPGAKPEIVQGPHGQPLYVRVTVSGDEITSLHGLMGHYFAGGSEQPLLRRDAALDFLWPADLPTAALPEHVEWTGSLRIPASGVYVLRTEGQLRVELNGKPPSPEGRFLPKGLHALRVVQEAPLSPGCEVARLLWTPPGGPEAPVPPEALFAISPPPNGLLGRYFQGGAWQGQPLFEQVNPVLLFAWVGAEPWPGPFSARWTGSIDAPSDGTYSFTVEADDGARLWLDGRVAGESLEPDTANLVETSVYLTDGRHPIQVDYFQRGGAKALELWWTPPGGKRQVVPPSALWPE